MSVTPDTMDHARRRVGSMVKDKWRLQALLGVGGTACVYAAEHRNGRRVAIKVLHPEMSAMAGVVTRFLREGYLANRVGHPNAVAVLDDDRTDDGAVFLVMELLEGHSLERYASAKGERLPRPKVLHLAYEALDVLAAAHAKGIVHRDIKPANLFMTVDGHIKVLDFGIARLAEPMGDGPLTHTGFAIGTPSFMPPEQARGRWELVDPRTDVWAVGATMYALLIGDRPRHGETTQEELLLAMTQPLPPIASLLPDLAPQVAAVVDRAVAYDRDARWPDAIAMRQAVGALLGEPASASSSPNLPPAPATLPSLVGGESPSATVAIPDGALTTGRPFSSQSLASRPGPSRAARGVIVGLAGFATLIAAVAIVLLVSRRGHAPPRAATAPPVSVAGQILPPASNASPPAPAIEPPPAPAASVSATASSHPSSRPVPAAPRGPADPFGQRF